LHYNRTYVLLSMAKRLFPRLNGKMFYWFPVIGAGGIFKRNDTKD
jgi:hypothetical protein